MREADLFIRYQPLEPCAFFCHPLAACCLRLELSAHGDFSVSSTTISRGCKPQLWPSFSMSLSFFNRNLSKLQPRQVSRYFFLSPSFSDRQLFFSRLQTSCGQVFIVFPLAPSFPGRPLSPATTSQDRSFAMFLAASLNTCVISTQPPVHPGRCPRGDIVKSGHRLRPNVSTDHTSTFPPHLSDQMPKAVNFPLPQPHQLFEWPKPLEIAS